MDAKLYQAFNVIEEKHWWFVARRAYIQAFLSRYMSHDGSLKLAEIGAGTGGNLRMLSNFGEIDAVEMDERALEFAVAKSAVIQRVVTVQRGWLPDNIPLPDQYDCVLALDVIEHVEQDQAAINTLLRLVRPSGYLVLTVPAYQWLWSPHDEVNHHYRRYTVRRVKSLFQGSDVKFIKVGYFNTLLFPIALVRRIFQRLTGGNENPQADLELPGKLTNRLLNFVFKLESKWAGVMTMPFGLSVITMVQKNED